MIDSVVPALGDFWSGVLLHLWQVTLILVPIFLIERLLRRAPASAIHVVWSTGLIKLFLPLALFGGLVRGAFQWLPETTLTLASQQANAALAAVTTVLTVPVLPAAPPQAGMSAAWLPWGIVGLSVFWIIGVIWLLVRLVLEIKQMNRIGGSPDVALSHEIRIKLNTVLCRADIPDHRIKICETAMLPSVFGFFKPIIIVPNRLLARLSEDELLAVLVHEDAHRRRFDPLQSLAHRLCAALFFFYPLIWPLLRRLREATEFACDEAAIRKGITADTYTRAVSKTLQLGLAPAGVVSMAGAGNMSFIKRRLDRLTFSRRSPMSLVHKIAIVSAVLLVGLGSFWPLQMAVGESNDSDSALMTAPAQEKDDQQKDEGKKDSGAKTKTIEVYTTETASKPPKIIKSDPPHFPEEARKAGNGAHVVVRLLVKPDGTPDSVTVDVKSKGHGEEFKKAVLESAAKWRFEPAEDDEGKPVEAWVKIKIQFNLDNGDEAAKTMETPKTKAKPKSEPTG